MSDRFGRRWPLTCNLLSCCCLSFSTSLVQTLHRFLAVRSLYGTAVRGIWGLAASTALENLPVERRGLGSGTVQQGYAIGYLLSAANLTHAPRNPHGWHTMFWFGSSFLFFSAVLRPKEIKKELGMSTQKKTRIFLKETKEMLERRWMLCIYGILMAGTSYISFRGTVLPRICFLITGFNFLSHRSQVRSTVFGGLRERG